MKTTLNIALIQTDIFWENPESNRIYLEKKLNDIRMEVDLIVLPEMFTTGFTMCPEKVSETMNGTTIAWLKSISENLQTAICGSLIIRENKQYYNRFVFVQANSEIHYYNKRHTFTLAGENVVYSTGKDKVIINYKGWKLCPMICYDLRFPVWSRNVEAYDVLLFVANWPKPRITAWNTLLKARAIENMSYCIGVNRIGVDGNNLIYPGLSGVYNCLGERLVKFNANEECIKIAELDKNHIKHTREKLKFLDDRDNFILA